MDRRSGKPSIPDEMAAIVWDHIRSVHDSLGGVIARTARHYKTSTTTIGKWIFRTGKPSFDTVLMISSIDHVPLDRLLFGTDRARPLIDIINAVFRCFPAVGQDDPIARTANESALMSAVKRLGGDTRDHEDALDVCRSLMEAGRIDNVDGWALLLARIEELDLAAALQTGVSDWRTSLNLARMRPPPERTPDDRVVESTPRPPVALQPRLERQKSSGGIAVPYGGVGHRPTKKRS